MTTELDKAALEAAAQVRWQCESGDEADWTHAKDDYLAEARDMILAYEAAKPAVTITPEMVEAAAVEFCPETWQGGWMGPCCGKPSNCTASKEWGDLRMTVARRALSAALKQEG